jgi:SAM-dependent methyltransferase
MKETETEWRRINQAWWDERAPIHLASDFYDLDAFRAGRGTLQPHEISEMGSVSNRSLLHLQCHFGQDALSWARRGARVTGVDFSEPAIEVARSLASSLGLDARFVLCDVYEALKALPHERFDIVYTGYGALCWLPDLDRWAEVAASFLDRGGILYLSEFHPLHHIIEVEERISISSDYFGDGLPRSADFSGSYADLSAETKNNETRLWTHPLGEVVTAILRAGLRLEFLHEREHLLYPRWSRLEKQSDATWRLPEGMPRIPMQYSLRAQKA